MTSKHVFAAFALFLALTPASADETAPFLNSKGELRFQTWLRLPGARGNYQPSVSFALVTGGATFFPAPRITLTPDLYYAFVDQSGEGVDPSQDPLGVTNRDGFNHWAVRVERSYLDLVPVIGADGWAVAWDGWDSTGNHYRFEDLAGDRQQYPILKVTDASGNRTEYEYAGTRLTAIRYNFYDPANPAATSAVPASSTSFASAVEFDYDTFGRIFRARILNRGASGLVTVRSYEAAWSCNSSTPCGLLSFTEITQNSARRLQTSFDYVGGQPSAIRTPRGARYDLVINPGSNRISSLTLSGPGLQTVTTNYWYIGSFSGPSQTVSQDSVTHIVRSTWWERQLRDVPARVDWGTETVPGNATTPPQYAVFKQRIAERTWRGIDSGTCVPPLNYSGTMIADVPPGTPSVPFESRERDTVWIDGVAMSRERTVACLNVDAYGNVNNIRVDGDLARSGDEYVESLTFAPPTSSHSCTDCVLTRSVIDYSTERLLSYERYTYDAAAHARELWREDQATATEQLVTGWDYNGNGTLHTTTAGPTIRSVMYQTPYQVRVAQETVTEGTKSLVTEYVYDDFGNPVLITGPYLAGGTVGPQQGYQRDDMGRVTAVARHAISGPTITDAIAAYEYLDTNTAPSSVTAYSFAVPRSFSHDPITGGGIPQSSDVVQSMVFFDALGRAIQTRERLGGTSAADAGAHVVDNLGSNTYRVSRAIVYDGAGRVTATLEPFYSLGAGFVDYRTGNTDALVAPVHVNLRTYDARGRVVCEAYRPASSGSPLPAPGACISNFDETSAYTRATATTYRAVNGLLGIKVIPPENNLATTPEGRPPTGPESLFDASGRLIETLDVDRNATVYSYDPLDHVTTIVRQPSTTESGRLASVSSSLTYGVNGRLRERTDPNVGTRTVWYDAQGNITRVQLPPRDLGSGVKGRDEVQFTYDMGRPSVTRTCVATSATTVSCTDEWVLAYDAPLDSAFGNTAGRLAYAQKAGLATIQYSYSPEGALNRRAYTLSGISGTFDITDTVLLDGRASGATLSSPAGSFSFSNDFDSYRRLARISSAAGSGTIYWRALIAPENALTGAYDPLGRVRSVDLDQSGTGPSLVHATWQYKPNSGLADAARVSLGLTDLDWVSGLTHRGAKLTAYRDEIGKTAFSYWYTDSGQLRGSSAVPFDASALSQNSFMCSSYTLTKSFGAGPSYGNVERVRELRTPAFTDTYAFAGLGVSTVVPPGPDAPTTITTNTTTKPYLYDHAGRLTSKALGAESFEYNVSGQLMRVLRGGVQAEALVYGPFGQLLGRVSGTAVTYYLDGRATVTAAALAGCTAPGCAIDPSTLKVDVHIRAGPRVASVRLQGGVLGRVLYYHRDRLGSVIATSLGGGSAGASYRFGSWGDTRVAQSDSGDSASERGFAGAIRLSGSLLVMGVRVYDSQLRQFLQPDALDPMMYTYVGGDPINRTDPTGLKSIAEDRAWPRLSETFFLTYGLEAGWEGYGVDVLRAHLPGAAQTPLLQFMDDLLLQGVAVVSGHGEWRYTEYPVPCTRSSMTCGSEATLEWVRDPPRMPDRMNSGGWESVKSVVEQAAEEFLRTHCGNACGVSFDMSTINPLTSGGGGSYGLNLEYTAEAGLHLYGYYTPNRSPSIGFLPGWSLTLNSAVGSGPWTGPFENYTAAVGLSTLGFFRSPTDGYTGINIGVGKGPGLGATMTEYQMIW
jgi:RHS repeat-associated protein